MLILAPIYNGAAITETMLIQIYDVLWRQASRNPYVLSSSLFLTRY